ncbi:MAG: phosphate ABC transporter permease subunit PstC [Anaerolineales bacterium]
MANSTDMKAETTSKELASLYQKRRKSKNQLAKRLMGFLTLLAVMLVPLLFVALFVRALPILKTIPLGELLLSKNWHPTKNAFGFYPFIIGTLWVTGLAMLLSVPPSVFTAIYLAEYSPTRIRNTIKSFIDILAGIPSVVFGVWGTLTIVPFIRNYLGPAIDKWLGFLPLFQNNNPSGYSLMAGGIVLAVMVFPIIIALAEEVISAVPQGLREASLTLGATHWQTTRRVVLRRAWLGVVAAVMLGFSRAFGETMAVMMVAGNVPLIPRSIFDPVYPLTALIANNYGEMMSIPLYDSALLTGALILLIIILVFNLFSRLVLVQIVKLD